MACFKALPLHSLTSPDGSQQPGLHSLLRAGASVQNDRAHNRQPRLRGNPIPDEADHPAGKGGGGTARGLVFLSLCFSHKISDNETHKALEKEQDVIKAWPPEPDLNGLNNLHSLAFAASTTWLPQPGSHSVRRPAQRLAYSRAFSQADSSRNLFPRHPTLRPASCRANSPPTTASHRSGTSTRSLWPDQDSAPPGSKPSRNRRWSPTQVYVQYRVAAQDRVTA